MLELLSIRLLGHLAEVYGRKKEESTKDDHQDDGENGLEDLCRIIEVDVVKSETARDHDLQVCLEYEANVGVPEDFAV